MRRPRQEQEQVPSIWTMVVCPRVRMAVRWELRAVYIVLVSVCSLVGVVRAGYDYGKALELSFHYFEAQRSGYLPANNRVPWRSNSGLKDGMNQGIDLTGGYYDAGDNVKFGLPMAYTITMLSWSVIEYGNQLQKQGQLQYALDSIKWGTDYFIKAHPEPNVLWAEVGDGDTDHYCWERPEDMTTSRQAYRIDPSHPGSEVAAETAAAAAAASIVFNDVDPSYSATLLTHAKQLFVLADTYRGKYDVAIPVVKGYYGSGPSGYEDELLWAAFWLFEATGDESYFKYAVDNADALGGTDWALTEFSWDVKYSGLQLLASKILLEGRGGVYSSILHAYKDKADFFICSALNKNSNGGQISRTPGGLFWTQSWNNMQFVTSASFLLTVYSNALESAGEQELSCSGSPLQTSELFDEAKSQIDYILGNNPRGASYMVGYGQKYPLYVHHRGSSIPSINVVKAQVGCREGYSSWYSSEQPNPNLLLGAVVGGPDQNDNYDDKRQNWQGSEPCVYNVAPLVGLLARLSEGP